MKYCHSLFAEVIESYQSIRNGNITRGSVDQLIACCGHVVDIFDCLLNKTGGGICSDDDYYPFHGTCHPNGCQPFTTVNNCELIRIEDDVRSCVFCF